jgi:hypothetical protein
LQNLRKSAIYQELTERKGIVDQVISSTPLISEAERDRRRAAIAYGRGSVRLEGFVVSPEAEALNQRYIDGELTREELTQAILKLHRA